MPDLIAKPALGRAPMTMAATTLAEAAWTRITSIAPFPGQAGSISAALAPLDLSFPPANRFVQSAFGRIAWSGREQAFLFGPEAPPNLAAAVTDQSDAWVMLDLTGPQAQAVLARLVPLDLRAATPGMAFRTALNHMPLLVMVDHAQVFRLLTFRSMARTAWHELQDALSGIDARLGLKA